MPGFGEGGFGAGPFGVGAQSSLATVQDVLDRYEGTASPGRVAVLLADAEADLAASVPDMAARIAAGTLDAGRVRRVLVWAVIRYLRNPEGYVFESAGDRSVSRGAAGAAAAGKVTFTAADLAGLLPAAARGTGWGTIWTPRAGEVAYSGPGGGR